MAPKVTAPAWQKRSWPEAEQELELSRKTIQSYAFEALRLLHPHHRPAVREGMMRAGGVEFPLSGRRVRMARRGHRYKVWTAAN